MLLPCWPKKSRFVVFQPLSIPNVPLKCCINYHLSQIFSSITPQKKKNKCPLKHVTILREKFVESIIFHGKKPGKTSPWVGFFEPGNSWSTENEGIRPPKKQGTYFTIGN